MQDIRQRIFESLETSSSFPAEQIAQILSGKSGSLFIDYDNEDFSDETFIEAIFHIKATTRFHNIFSARCKFIGQGEQFKLHAEIEFEDIAVTSGHSDFQHLETNPVFKETGPDALELANKFMTFVHEKVYEHISSLRVGLYSIQQDIERDISFYEELSHRI